MTGKEFRPLTYQLMFPVFVHEHPEQLKAIIRLFFPDVEIGRLIPEKPLWEYFGIHTETDPEFELSGLNETDYLINDIEFYKNDMIEVTLMRYLDDECDEEERETESIVCLFSPEPFNGSQNVLSRYEVVDVLNGNRRYDDSPRILAVSYCGNDSQLNHEQKAFLQYLKNGCFEPGSALLAQKIHEQIIAMNHSAGWRTFMDLIGSIQCGDHSVWDS